MKKVCHKHSSLLPIVKHLLVSVSIRFSEKIAVVPLKYMRYQNLKNMVTVLLMGICLVAGGTVASAEDSSQPNDVWQKAQQRGEIYAECGQDARQLLQGWLDKCRDPKTQLVSRSRNWDYHNEAADHYSSLVVMAFYVAPQLNENGGTLYQTLVNARKLCSGPDGIPYQYDLRKQEPSQQASLNHLAEWLRDGLIRIVELKGTDNIWYDELLRLTDAMLAKAENDNGLFQSFKNHEAAGNMLQTLSRLYAFSGDEKYLFAAEKIADGYLLDPENAISDVHFRDHGCELVPGLAELFVLESKLGRPKAQEYREPMKRLLDQIVANAAQPVSGLFCKKLKDDNGKFQWCQPPDTWGYVLFSYENYDRATSSEQYRKTIEKPLCWLMENRSQYDKFSKTLWPRAISRDDWSDSYESMMVLWSCYPQVGDAFMWLDWATKQAGHRQQTDKIYGPFTGTHHDGSTGRCLVTHMMLCSQGVRNVPFRDDVCVGAVSEKGKLFMTVAAESLYDGMLCFDGPRTEHKGATIDWARINEMPQWFVVRPEETYSVTIIGQRPRTFKGQALIDGLPIKLEAAKTQKICVERTDQSKTRIAKFRK